jgi:hypothetical protein
LNYKFFLYPAFKALCSCGGVALFNCISLLNFNCVLLIMLCKKLSSLPVPFRRAYGTYQLLSNLFLPNYRSYGANQSYKKHFIFATISYISLPFGEDRWGFLGGSISTPNKNPAALNKTKHIQLPKTQYLPL